MRIFLVLALALVASPAAASSLADTIARVDPDGSRTDFESLLVDMAGDAGYATRTLDGADRTFASLTDSLLAFVSMTEPEALARMDGLYEIRDKVDAPADRPPLWSEVQWQGLRLLERIAPDPEVARDVRFERELREAFAVAEPQRAATVRGVVDVARAWWAERGDDPALTHDASRILDVEPWLARLDLGSDDPDAWTAPRLLADLDDDLVLHRRVARLVDPDRHAHLAAELVQALRTFPEDFEAQGIMPRRWDPARGRTVGHNTADLWDLALELLERSTGRAFSGPDDAGRRLAALGWWEGAQYQARYWRDPRSAPSLARFLEKGLQRSDGTPRRAAEWARELYLERGIRDVVLDRLDARYDHAVAELINLLPMPAAQAHTAGFAMAYRSDVVDQPGVTRRVAIDWDRARAFVRRILSQLTGVEEPAGIDTLPAGAQASFWLDWWAEHRDEPRWSREGFDVPKVPATVEKPRFETRSGRID